ncbi:ClpXP protease specificity-enhancing factor [Aquabacterium sp. A08]|uniref:ClpXP protease specificity-enhancing factor n=1 Tax=Aquabacterium sp. A08 TaxID=2718532 RepID=UPI0014227CFD|nr:ClpXP protease specificity-enhancing factor [Aquabacterium sp. A08]NIC40147.1 ClpXP protease specificity-enhancing factor [Aquabacterium sp. A08]
MDRDDIPSTRPYLIRALHEWCTDNGYTPYLAVAVDASVQVPREFVKDNEIVLNTSLEATSQLQLDNDFVSFKARFGGVPREVVVPVDHVVAIYARENGQGMAFPPPKPLSEAEAGVQRLQVVPAPGADVAADRPEGGDEPPPAAPAGGRPALKRVK